MYTVHARTPPKEYDAPNECILIMKNEPLLREQALDHAYYSGIWLMPFSEKDPITRGSSKTRIGPLLVGTQRLQRQLQGQRLNKARVKVQCSAQQSNSKLLE